VCSSDLFTFGNKYFEKGPTPIAFKRLPNIMFGKNDFRHTDLCIPIRKDHYETVYDKDKNILYEMPVGGPLDYSKGHCHYWNYDYTFKTKEVTKKEFWRFSKAYNRYYGSWEFGSTEEDSFDVFMRMNIGRHDRSPYIAKIEDHPIHIQNAIRNLTPEQFGFNARQ
jgi:hypothetical protein